MTCKTTPLSCNGPATIGGNHETSGDVFLISAVRDDRGSVPHLDLLDSYAAADLRSRLLRGRQQGFLHHGMRERKNRQALWRCCREISWPHAGVHKRQVVATGFLEEFVYSQLACFSAAPRNHAFAPHAILERRFTF